MRGGYLVRTSKEEPRHAHCFDGPTMKRLLAGVCVIAVGSSACSASGMSLGLGGVAAIAGGSILASRQDVPDCDHRIPYACLGSASVEASNDLSTAAGTTLLVFSAVLLGLGVWGMAAEAQAQETKGAPLSLAVAPAVSDLQVIAQTLPAQPEVRDPRQKKLVLHIRLAARADRCAAAMYMLNQLRELDAPLAQSLAKGDEHVAHCAVVRGASLRG